MNYKILNIYNLLLQLLHIFLHSVRASAREMEVIAADLWPKSDKTPPHKKLCGGADFKFSCVEDLLPGGVDRLADQEGRVDALTRPEFLHAARIHFGDVEIAVLIDRESMHAPETAGEVAPDAPRVQEVSLQIVFQHL